MRTFGVVRPPAAGGRPRQSYGRGGGLERRVRDGTGAAAGRGRDAAAAAADALSAQHGGRGCGGRGRLHAAGGHRQLGVHVEAVQQSGAHRAAARRHRRRHCPPVDPRVVPLGRVQARVAVVAAQHQQPAVQLDHVVRGPAKKKNVRRLVTQFVRYENDFTDIALRVKTLNKFFSKKYSEHVFRPVLVVEKYVSCYWLHVCFRNTFSDTFFFEK